MPDLWRAFEQVVQGALLPWHAVNVICSNDEAVAMMRILMEVALDVAVCLLLAGVSLLMASLIIIEDAYANSNLNRNVLPEVKDEVTSFDRMIPQLEPNPDTKAESNRTDSKSEPRMPHRIPDMRRMSKSDQFSRPPNP